MIKDRVFLVLLLAGLSFSTKALTWNDLWENPDQQGYQALKQNNWQQAVSDFNSPEWQALAYYRMGNYKKALELFSKAKNATAVYNSGNALALLGRYPDAIAAYDEALALDASFDDAHFNRDVLVHLLNKPSATPTPQSTPPFKRKYVDKKKNADDAKAAAQPDKRNKSENTPEENLQPENLPAQNTEQPASPETAPEKSVAQSYQDQQQQQALDDINDDPGGLLQRKLERDYEKSQQ